MKGIFVKASADTAAQTMCIRDFPEPYLETLGAAVGGDAELVRPNGLERPYCMVVNESGLPLGLPVNLLGSILYDPTLSRIEAQQSGFDSERRSRDTCKQDRLRACAAVIPCSDDAEHGHPIVGNIVILKTEYDPEAMGDRLAGLSDAETGELVAELRTMTGGRVQYRKEE